MKIARFIKIGTSVAEKDIIFCSYKDGGTNQIFRKVKPSTQSKKKQDMYTERITRFGRIDF